MVIFAPVIAISEQEHEMKTSTKLLVMYIYALLLFVHAYFVVRRLSLGKSRLAAALPAIVGCFALPFFLLDPFNPAEALLITPLGGIFSMAAFKLLAFCLGRGPLTLPLTPAQFGAVLVVPIIPAHVFAVSGGSSLEGCVSGLSTSQLAANYAKESAGVLVVISILLSFPGLHWFPRHWLYTLSSCLFLGAVFDILAAAVTLLLQMPVAPSFNKPWLSDSFADFWARRWNLTTTYMMRAMIYEPVLQGCFIHPCVSPIKSAQAPSTPAPYDPPRTRPEPTAVNVGTVSSAKTRKPIPGDKSTEDAGCSMGQPRRRKPVSKMRRFLALQATFMFSGVWHILVFAYNTRQISLRWALFFIIQAPIVMIESLLVKAWRAANLPTLPRALRIILTNAALIAVAGPLFFGPADETGFVRRNTTVAAPLLQRLFGLVGLQPISAAIAKGAAEMP